MFVEDAFDEMDEALQRQQQMANAPPPLAAFPPPQYNLTAVQEQHQQHPQPAQHYEMYARPSQDEQAWLDQEYEMMVGEPSDDEGDSQTEEDEYVRRLLAMHPGVLSDEEARWLYQRERHMAQGGGG